MMGAGSQLASSASLVADIRSGSALRGTQASVIMASLSGYLTREGDSGQGEEGSQWTG